MSAANSNNRSVQTLRDAFGDPRPPDISRRITACVACRKQKVSKFQSLIDVNLILMTFHIDQMSHAIVWAPMHKVQGKTIVLHSES